MAVKCLITDESKQGGKMGSKLLKKNILSSQKDI